jgi:hypothetical protein
MNTGQMMLVVGSITLLSLLALSINQKILGQTQTMLDSEASLNAISIAQSLIDEIQTKLYDDTTRNARVFDKDLTTLLASPTSLGPSSDERSLVQIPDDVFPHRSVLGYSDINDYNGYIRYDTTSLMKGFRDSVAVYYVTEGNIDQRSIVQTCFKRIDVVITHPCMTKPLRLSDVSIYRRFF